MWRCSRGWGLPGATLCCVASGGGLSELGAPTEQALQPRFLGGGCREEPRWWAWFFPVGCLASGCSGDRWARGLQRVCPGGPPRPALDRCQWKLSVHFLPKVRVRSYLSSELVGSEIPLLPAPVHGSRMEAGEGGSPAATRSDWVLGQLVRS